MPTTIAQAISGGAIRLDGIADNPRLEARLLLAHALGLTQNDLIRDPNRPVDAATFEALVTRRTAREPLALIVGLPVLDMANAVRVLEHRRERPIIKISIAGQHGVCEIGQAVQERTVDGLNYFNQKERVFAD